MSRKDFEKFRLILYIFIAIFAFKGLSNSVSTTKAEVIHDTIVKEKVVYKTTPKGKTATKRKVAKSKVAKTTTKTDIPVPAPTAKVNYRISEDGKKMIMQHEGCKLDVYADSWGWSIGYGHFMGAMPTMTTITQKEAEKLFREDIKEVEASINALLVTRLDTKGYKFSQDFIDGVGDLIYNCGSGNFEKSDIYTGLQKKVRWGHPDKVNADIRFLASKVRSYRITAEGHKARRKVEAELMASND